MLGHKKIMQLARRPHANVEEMNKYIIDTYKNTVKRGDNVYFLGDLVWHTDILYKFFHEIFAHEKYHNFHWILGNHDFRYKSKAKEIANSRKNVHIHEGIHEIKIYDDDNRKYRIVLSHYPMITWNCSHFGSWQLYGHHHNDYSGDFKFLSNHVPCMGKQYNVAWDFNNYKFVNFNDLKKIMEDKPDNWDLLPSEKKEKYKNGTRLGNAGSS